MTSPSPAIKGDARAQWEELLLSPHSERRACARLLLSTTTDEYVKWLASECETQSSSAQHAEDLIYAVAFEGAVRLAQIISSHYLCEGFGIASQAAAEVFGKTLVYYLKKEEATSGSQAD